MIDDPYPVFIRLAEPDDAKLIYELLSLFAVSQLAERVAFDRTYLNLLASEDANLLVATNNKIVIGYALAQRMVPLYANGEIWSLQELMVAPKYRNRGIGRKLFGRVIDDARARDPKEIVVPSRRGLLCEAWLR
jgi:ribosomal protein S18 acetylase RimI-like enzyme